MGCTGWPMTMVIFPVFPAFSFISLKVVFYTAPLGSTVAYLFFFFYPPAYW